MNDQLNDSVHSLTGAYAVDAVDDLERARFERHLLTCDECVAEVRSLQAAASQLAHLAQVLPPTRLREQVLQDIAAVRPLPPEALARMAEPVQLTSRSAQHPRRRGTPRWLSVAAAVVLVGGGASLAVTHPWDRQSQGQTTVADRVLQDPQATHHSTPFPGGASAEVVSSDSLGRAVIVTKNMPDPPSGKVYQLWFEKGGAFYSAGLMPRQADQVTVLDGNAAGASAVGITEEPEGGSAQPTTAPLALISVV